MFNGIALSLWIDEASRNFSYFIIGSIAIIIIGVIYLLIFLDKEKLESKSNYSFTALEMIFIIWLLLPSRDVRTVMIDEAISAKTNTELSEKSWAIINDFHSKINKE